MRTSRLLSRYSYIDLIDKNEEDAEHELLAGVRAWRAKPSSKPAFPGAKPDSPAFPGSREVKDKRLAKVAEA